MNDQSHIIRFNLRDIFICTTLVGIGVLTLKYPYSWVLCLVNLAVSFSIVFALISAVAGTGNRRLFHATYGVTAMTIFVIFPVSELWFLDIDWLETIYSSIYSENAWSVEDSETQTWFVLIFWRWLVVMLSTAAAYTIPWLVTRRHSAPQ